MWTQSTFSGIDVDITQDSKFYHFQYFVMELKCNQAFILRTSVSNHIR